MRKDLTFILLLFCFTVSGCGNSGERLNFIDRGREVPVFSADSAFDFVEEQVAFGPRNPNSEGHRQTRDYLISKLSAYAGEQNVFAQNFEHEGYDGETLQLTNIIAAFNTTATDRIMLCAHWDTRPRAERDPDNPDSPILGADDGGSGVAVLLELARIFQTETPPIGVDIVLFDGEDYGRENDPRNYFLGSRYWANNPPVAGYSPRFGILLDMVGGEGAVFPQERNSYTVAPDLMEEIWSVADEQGYSSLFLDEMGSAVSDDHVVINNVLRIPTIDIIRHRRGENANVTFAPYWHTHEDDMDIISRETLGAVGEVLVELIYNRI